MASKYYPPVTPISQPNVAAKPLSINNLGLVTFTDKLGNELTPNESLCRAYGYTFDIATNTCRAFPYTSNIQKSLRDEDNTVNGQGNILGIGASNSYVMGSQNTISGNSRNNIVVGNNNSIAENVDNANVFGTFGEVTATNSIVLGGNSGAAGTNPLLDAVTDGTFPISTSAWTVGADWAVGNYKLVGTSSGAITSQSIFSSATSRDLEITFTINEDYVSGEVAVYMSGETQTWYSAAGTYTRNITSSAQVLNIEGRSTSNFTGSISDVSVRYTSHYVAPKQSIHLMYGRQTTDNSVVYSYLNGITDSYFVVPTNTLIYFQSETLAVRVGGSSGSGSVGDYKSWVERGVVKNASGTLSIERSRTSPAGKGVTTGWSPVNSVSGTNFLQTVEGAADMTLEWASTIRMTQIKTGVTL